MTEKLNLLEERVQETVEGVGSIVEDVGGIVKDVEDMVKDAKATVGTTLAAVRQGVAGAQSSVEEIVEQVKDTIGETAATMQRTLDLPTQVEQHPWSMFGGAVLAGYLLGSWSESHSAAGPTAVPASEAVRRPGSPSAVPALTSAPPPQPGLVGDVLEQLQDEMVTLKSAAVEALMSTLRAMVKQAIPALAPHLEHAKTRPGHQSQHPMQPPAARFRTAGNGSSSSVRPGEEQQQVQTV
jgi:ElaB/YqjD/DUF883 family membrane-anchored ribosome-binding protein